MSLLGRLRFSLRGAVVERFLSYDATDFARALTTLGIRSGDVLMVHSSIRPASGFRGKPLDMINVLKHAVGPNGLLVMPSMTYSGSSKAFLEGGGELRVHRHPSRMGLMSEVFRRGKDTYRSLSPTHPLLAWGNGAAPFLADHHKTDRPFGPESPFARLLAMEGKILCVNAAPETITFTHFLEDRIQEKLPFALYEPACYTGRVIEADGTVHNVPTRVLSDESRRRRREEKLWRRARRTRVIHRARVGITRIEVVSCSDLTALVDTMYSEGESLFAAAS